MPYDLEISPSAVEELNQIRPFDRRRIADAIESQLRHEPTVETRNRKQHRGTLPEIADNPPVWQLRVGQFRVFYTVNEHDDAKSVHVLAVRMKPPHTQTEAIT